MFCPTEHPMVFFAPDLSPPDDSLCHLMSERDYLLAQNQQLILQRDHAVSVSHHFCHEASMEVEHTRSRCQALWRKNQELLAKVRQQGHALSTLNDCVDRAEDVVKEERTTRINAEEALRIAFEEHASCLLELQATTVELAKARDALQTAPQERQVQGFSSAPEPQTNQSEEYQRLKNYAQKKTHEVGTLTTKITELEASIAELEKNIEDLKSDLVKEREVKVVSPAKGRKGLTKENSRLRDQVRELSEEKSKLAVKHADLQVKFKTLQLELSDLTDRTQRQISTLQEELLQLKKDVEGKKVQISCSTTEPTKPPESGEQSVVRYSREILLQTRGSPLSHAPIPNLPDLSCIVIPVASRRVSTWTRETRELPGPQSIKDEELVKKARSILNKLTPEKFDKLMAQVKALPLDNASRLEGVAQLVVDKASNEPHFAEMYGRFCSELRSTTEQFASALQLRCKHELDRVSSGEEEPRRTALARQLAEQPEDVELRDRLQELDSKIRWKKLGFCTFLGELYKCGILDRELLLSSIQRLMQSDEEDSWECVCNTIKRVGPSLEADCSKEMVGELIRELDRKLGEAPDSRLRFMLMDLREMRMLGWRPRGKEACKPLTLAQIDEEASKDALFSPRQPGTSRGQQDPAPRQATPLSKSKYSPRPELFLDPSTPSPSQSPRPSWGQIKLGQSSELAFLPSWMKK